MFEFSKNSKIKSSFFYEISELTHRRKKQPLYETSKQRVRTLTLDDISKCQRETSNEVRKKKIQRRRKSKKKNERRNVVFLYLGIFPLMPTIPMNG